MRMRGTMRAVVAASVLLAALGCGASRRDAAADAGTVSSFRAVEAAHGAFVAARSALGEAEARGDDDVRRAARARFDAAYRTEQRALAAFLTVAVNRQPHAPETSQALAMYAAAAVANARTILGRGGDPSAAVATLEGAARLYRALELPPPAELDAALAAARRGRAPTPGAARGN